jgi:MFS family permease
VVASLRSVLTRLGTAAGDVGGDGPVTVLAAVALGWALSIGVRFVYPALLPFLRAEFGFGLSTAGVLLSLLWAAYAVGHVPGGALGDRLGEGRVLVLSTLVSTAALGGVAAATGLAVLFAATITFGLATALYGPTRFTVLTDVFPEDSGSAVGLTMAAGNVGNAGLPVAATAVAAAMTWRAGFGVFVPCFALAALAIQLAVPARTSAPTPTVGVRETVDRLGGALRGGAIPTVVAVQVSLSFLIQGFASFYPAYLTTKGLSPEVAAPLFGAFFALGAVVQPAAGALMDRVGVRTTLLGCYTGCLAALWALPFVDGLVPIAVLTALFSTWNGTIVVTQTYIADTLPTDLQGTGFGTLKAGWMVLGATAPLLVGVMADAGLFDEAFVLLGAVGGVGLAVAAVGLRPHERTT